MTQHHEKPFAIDAEAQARLGATLAAARRGLFSDLDGTLSAIAPTPQAATLLPQVRELLTEARSIFTVVVVVSGRTASEAARLVQVPDVLYIGNHGWERAELSAQAGSRGRGLVPRQTLPQAASYERSIDDALVTIKSALGRRFPGIWIEPKGATGSIHLRATAQPEEAEAEVFALAQDLAAQHNLRATRGKLVVELRPAVDVDKGTVVADVIQEHSLGGALYLGDDQTDLDAFRTLRRLDAARECAGVTVAVRGPDAPVELEAESDIRLATVEQVPAFLRWLLDAARHDGARPHPVQ
ncbi:MAG: trehalose-phosphatase [Ktedonobacterales bacterium]